MEGMIRIGDGEDFVRERCELALARLSGLEASALPLYGPYFAAVRDLALGEEAKIAEVSGPCGPLLGLWALELSCLRGDSGFTEERTRLLETSVQLLSLFEAGDASEKAVREVLYDHFYDYAPDSLKDSLDRLLFPAGIKGTPAGRQEAADGHVLRALLPAPADLPEEDAAGLRERAKGLSSFFGDRLKGRILQAVGESLEEIKEESRQQGLKAPELNGKALILPELGLMADAAVHDGSERRIRLLLQCRKECMELIRNAFPGLEAAPEEEAGIE